MPGVIDDAIVVLGEHDATIGASKYTQIAYIRDLRIDYMKATFVELPAFERLRPTYLDDDDFSALQQLLMKQPDAGILIPGTGGLRKLRFRDRRRHKGTRGGIRLIYYWWYEGSEFWLFTLYDKDEASDLTPEQRAKLKTWVKAELIAKSLK